MAAVATEKPKLGLENIWRCVRCGGDASLDEGAVVCPSCAGEYPVRDGVAIVKGEVDANNAVARTFYDGPLWPKFRFWEWVTFLGCGGEKRARNRVLRLLPNEPNLRLLDVAVGDGVYLPWLPESWSVFGVDVSPVQLEACKGRIAGRNVQLAQGEAEQLPVRDGAFDACLSIGAFNYFNDPEKSLREMARAVKPGGTIVVCDEIPDLSSRLPFGKVGLGKLDRWIEAKIMKNLGPEFIAMVERHKRLDVAELARRVLPGCRYELIWNRMAYVLVGVAPG
jgi:ubiquinone/menaquinone biosynthesis C-methylase UbiE